jgi:hypothetical protein
MNRMNIYLPSELRQRLKLRAQQARRPEAEVIRDLLEEGLERTPASPGNPLLDLAKLAVTGGPADLSRNLDKYLYEDA